MNWVAAVIAMAIIALVSIGVGVNVFVASGDRNLTFERRQALKHLNVDDAKRKQMSLRIHYLDTTETNKQA